MSYPTRKKGERVNLAGTPIEEVKALKAKRSARSEVRALVSSGLPEEAHATELRDSTQFVVALAPVTLDAPEALKLLRAIRDALEVTS